MDQNRWKADRRGWRLLLWLGGGLLSIAVLVVLATCWAVLRSRQADLGRARTQSANLATELSQNLAGEVARVDLALRDCERQLRPLLDDPDTHAAEINALLREELALLPEVDDLRLTDAHGSARLGTGPNAEVPVDVGDRDYFRRLRDDAQAGLVVSEPLLLRRRQAWGLVLARRATQADGDFAGVLYATLDSARLAAHLDDLDVGRQGAIALRSPTLALAALTRGSDMQTQGLGSRDVSAELRQALARAPEQGEFVSRWALDGVERASAYRRVRPGGLLVLVGLATDEYLAAHRGERQLIVVLSALALLALGASSAAAWQSWRAQAQTARELGERQRLTLQLAQAAAEYQDLYDRAPCGYHSLDAQGRYLHINATELGWLGCTREEVLGRLRPTDFFTGEGRALFARSFPEFLASGEVHGLAFDLLGRDGTRRRVSVSATASFDDRGRLLMSRSVMHDITEQHRAHETLRQLSAEQRAMLDNDLVGMVRLRERRITWANRGAHRMLGFADGDLLGRPTRELYLDEPGWQRVGTAVYAELARHGSFRWPQELRRRDGQPIWVDMHGGLLPADGAWQDSMWLLVDITDLRRHQQELEHVAAHDPLTGLPNRRLLEDRLQQALAQARRSGRPLAVAVLDLDAFKPVNDQYGHAVGDLVLQTMAQRLASQARAADTVCRLGGDEFALVLPELGDAAEAEAALRRMAAALDEPIALPGSDEAVRLGASIGLALFPDDDTDAEQLLQCADDAMYVAKAQGKYRVHRWQAGERVTPTSRPMPLD